MGLEEQREQMVGQTVGATTGSFLRITRQSEEGALVLVQAKRREEEERGMQL